MRPSPPESEIPPPPPRGASVEEQPWRHSEYRCVPVGAPRRRGSGSVAAARRQMMYGGPRLWLRLADAAHHSMHGGSSLARFAMVPPTVCLRRPHVDKPWERATVHSVASARRETVGGGVRYRGREQMCSTVHSVAAARREPPNCTLCGGCTQRTRQLHRLLRERVPDRLALVVGEGPRSSSRCRLSRRSGRHRCRHPHSATIRDERIRTRIVINAARTRTCPDRHRRTNPHMSRPAHDT